jgi:hypothetical protein
MPNMKDQQQHQTRHESPSEEHKSKSHSWYFIQSNYMNLHEVSIINCRFDMTNCHYDLHSCKVVSHHVIWEDLMFVLNNIIKAQILLKGWLTFLMPVTLPYGLLLLALWRPLWLVGVLNPPVRFQSGGQL